jgi:hypothetical protein
MGRWCTCIVNWRSELGELCQQYSGFGRLMQKLEKISSDIKETGNDSHDSEYNPFEDDEQFVSATSKKSKKPKKKKFSLQERVAKLDRQASNILDSGGAEALMMSIPKFMDDLAPIMHADNNEELDRLCEEYHGFYTLMNMIENLAHGIKEGKIKVPQW